jgi:plasmid replication initiation protein
MMSLALFKVLTITGQLLATIYWTIHKNALCAILIKTKKFQLYEQTTLPGTFSQKICELLIDYKYL